MNIISPAIRLLAPLAAFLLLGVYLCVPAAAQGPVGLSGGFGAGVREVIEIQSRLLTRTDSARQRLQEEVIVETGAGRSATEGAGEAARPTLCPPPTEAFVCGLVVPAAVLELQNEPPRDFSTEPTIAP